MSTFGSMYFLNNQNLLSRYYISLYVFYLNQDQTEVNFNILLFFPPQLGMTCHAITIIVIDTKKHSKYTLEKTMYHIIDI